MKYIYEIKEENVDGCGGDAVEYVSSENPLTQEEQDMLKNCLDNVKQKACANEDDADTHDMICDAMNLFQEMTGKSLEHANDTISGFITF